MKKTERLNRNYRTEWSVFFTTMMMIWILESHYLVAISPAQESPDALLKNAKAVFDVIPDPTPEDIQTRCSPYKRRWQPVVAASPITNSARQILGQRPLGKFPRAARRLD